MKGRRYKNVIMLYLKQANLDFIEAKTETEKILSKYLIYELNSIIDDVENKGLGK